MPLIVFVKLRKTSNNTKQLSGETHKYFFLIIKPIKHFIKFVTRLRQTNVLLNANECLLEV